MKTRIKNIEECTKLFQIEVPSDLVERTRNDVYQDIKKVAKVPGFRAGSVPQDLLEKRYSKDAENEILKRLIPEGYKKALQDHKVVPVGLPRISNVNFEAGKPLTFEAQVDIRPNTKLKNYKGIKVSKERISVSQQEIDEGLSRLRGIYAKYNDVARPIEKGDYAVCDVEAFIEDKPISKKNENMWVLVDKEASLLGMGEELVGLTKGQAKDIEAKLPDNYPEKKYAGKLAKFKIAVKEIKEKHLPLLDDAFAKNLNMNTENLDQLKKEIESQLFMRKEDALKTDMENQILDKLLSDNKISVPTGMVKQQKDVLMKRLEEEFSRQSLAKEEISKKIKELDSSLEKEACDKVRSYFILDDIAVKEKIEVSDKDINDRIKATALSTGYSAEEVKKYYEKENLLDGLRENIKEGKVLEFLLKGADITESV
ncbi:MAG: trigger factor [Omnitrophica bacterium RBG_13_46_9]|nr:MAG: trigger factor [Omnitrophica bacterium RBG_13_46_9]